MHKSKNIFEIKRKFKCICQKKIYRSITSKGCTGQLPDDLQRNCEGSQLPSRTWLYATGFRGSAKDSNFKLTNQALDPLKKGEFYTKAVYWSVDPYLRAFCHNFEVNGVMPGMQIAEVVESRNAKFKEGSLVHGHYGWRDLTKVDPRTTPTQLLNYNPQDCIPLSLHLSYMGMTGNAAYFGMTQIAKPKQRHTVVVSGAGGAVGSHAGQLAKLRGSTVIGITGSEEKCAWCRNELGFDFSINYKTQDIAESLQEYACNGVDIYWDNVGGYISSKVMPYMNKYGQVLVCGAISTYNQDCDSPPSSPSIQGFIYRQQLSVQGFLVNSFVEDWDVGVAHNKELIMSGKLKYKEWITQGFDNIPATFIAMMEGDNIGKTLIKNINDVDGGDECDCMVVNRKLAKEGTRS